MEGEESGPVLPNWLHWGDWAVTTQDSSSIHWHFHLHLPHPKPSVFGLPALVTNIKISGEKAFTVVLIEIHRNY